MDKNQELYFYLKNSKSLTFDQIVEFFSSIEKAFSEVSQLEKQGIVIVSDNVITFNEQKDMDLKGYCTKGDNLFSNDFILLLANCLTSDEFSLLDFINKFDSFDIDEDRFYLNNRYSSFSAVKRLLGLGIIRYEDGKLYFNISKLDYEIIEGEYYNREYDIEEIYKNQVLSLLSNNINSMQAFFDYVYFGEESFQPFFSYRENALLSYDLSKVLKCEVKDLVVTEIDKQFIDKFVSVHNARVKLLNEYNLGKEIEGYIVNSDGIKLKINFSVNDTVATIFAKCRKAGADKDFFKANKGRNMAIYYYNLERKNLVGTQLNGEPYIISGKKKLGKILDYYTLGAIEKGVFTLCFEHVT